MINIFHIVLCISIPLCFTAFFTIYSYRKLSQNPLINLSKFALVTFELSRAFYFVAFGILIVAFILGIILYDVGGEQTRRIVASSRSENYNSASLILSDWSNVLLPIIFVSIFVALFSLGYIGKLVLNTFPTDGKPGKEFSGFRFTFFLMTISLMIPPLLFASLLLI